MSKQQMRARNIKKCRKSKSNEEEKQEIYSAHTWEVLLLQGPVRGYTMSHPVLLPLFCSFITLLALTKT